mgnify:CR=1 FL=1
MRVCLLFSMLLCGCTGLAWNTTVANDEGNRWAMLSSIEPGVSTEIDVTTRWGRPTQKIREGGETRFVYRDMTNPPGYLAPQFGTSTAYVVVVFQYGIATRAYSSDTEGCRGTFAPRPPGHGFDNPGTVYPANCGGQATRTTVSDQQTYGGEEGKL